MQRNKNKPNFNKKEKKLKHFVFACEFRIFVHWTFKNIEHETNKIFHRKKNENGEFSM